MSEINSNIVQFPTGKRELSVSDTDFKKKFEYVDDPLEGLLREGDLHPEETENFIGSDRDFEEFFSILDVYKRDDHLDIADEFLTLEQQIKVLSEIHKRLHYYSEEIEAYLPSK